MEEAISFQAPVVEGFQITIPKATRAFKNVTIGDIVDVRIVGIKAKADVIR